jgi:hypothetical protein
VTLVGASSANANDKRASAIHLQLARYYHADGFIKAIGHVAYRTIYNSNDKIRHAWKIRLHKLVLARADAHARIVALRTPPAPARPPHYAEWMCIHRYEGAWNDPNPPYWGGLQMDLAFMEAYGSNLLRTKGTADHWTPLEQMWVAENAWQSRGFWPWPTTARYCGLI